MNGNPPPLDSFDALHAGLGREFSAVDIVNATLERIVAWEPRIAAWSVIDAEGALMQARDLDDRIARGDAPGSLAGLVIGIKDIFDVAGLPTSNGVVPDAPLATKDSTVVARLRAAGAIIMGKTTTTGFAWADPTQSRNPWNETRSPGGSSAGSGAAVGAGTILAGMGSQTGGSTLRPAAFNGAVGLKPTFGRLSRTGVTPLAPSLDHPGIIARSVAIAAAVLDAASGVDPTDPASLPGPATRSAQASPLPRPWRFAVWSEAMHSAEGDVRAGVQEAIRKIEADGGMVHEFSFPLDLILAVHSVVMHVEATAVHRDLTDPRPDLYVPRIRANVRIGALIPGEVFLRASRIRRKLRTRWNDAVSGYDAILLPTASTVAPTPETTGDFSLQAPGSLLGLPAISLPCGLNAAGLPIGLQVIGRHGEDEAIVRAAAAVEQVIGSIPLPA